MQAVIAILAGVVLGGGSQREELKDCLVVWHLPLVGCWVELDRHAPDAMTCVLVKCNAMELQS